MFLPKNNNINIRVSPFISAVTRSSTGTRSIKRPTMAVGNKGGKKKAVDPFAKKDWYDIKAPSNDYIFAKKDWYDIKNVFAEKAPSV